jgi:guanylate kinase
MNQGIVIVVTGASGAGKTTVVEAVLKEMPGTARLVTTTDRSPRPGEVDGVDYHFLTREDFKARQEQGEFLEWAETYNHYYGSSRVELEKLRARHRAVFAIVDLKGARAFKAAYPDCVTVFINPGTVEELRRRLLARPGTTREALKERLDAAAAEMAQAGEFDRQVANLDGRLADAVAVLRQLAGGG